MQVSKVLVEALSISDYVPVVSTVSNVVVLFLKCIAEGLPKKYLNNYFWSYVKYKDLSRCTLALLPVLGNVKLFLDDKKEYKQNKIDCLNQPLLLIDLMVSLNSLNLPKNVKDQLKTKSDHLTGGQKILLLSCFMGNEEKIKKILEEKISPNIDYPISPLHLACMHGNLEMVKMLVTHGADLNSIALGLHGYTSLAIAIILGKQDIAEYLCAQGANTSQGINPYDDPFQCALLYGDQAKLLPALLSKDEDVDQRSYEITPLIIVKSGSLESIVKSPVTIKDFTPFSFAVFVGATNSALYLLERTKDIPHATSFGDTALHFAASHKNPKLLRAILEKNHDSIFVNQQNNSGFTALMSAIVFGNVEAVKELIKQGADIFTKFKISGSEEEQSAFDLACRLNCHEVIACIDQTKLDEFQKEKMALMGKIAGPFLPYESQCEVHKRWLEKLNLAGLMNNVQKNQAELPSIPRTGMEILYGRLV